MIWPTIIFLMTSGFIIWSGIRSAKRSYYMGYGDGYKVGHAQGKLDYAQELLKKAEAHPESDEAFLKRLRVRP